MNNNTYKKLSFLLVLSAVFSFIMTGCEQPNETAKPNTPTVSTASSTNSPSSASVSDTADDASSDTNLENDVTAAELYVTFGDNGSPFTMHLYENDTAAAIARHVGSADWRLPIYNYDGYENWEVMQYYDIPSRYEIPSNPESITSEVSGTVYYSEPNRIVLFYGDATVSGEYTPVGYFDPTEEFVSAVKDNPVLEGWGNKIIKISANE